MVMYLLKDLMGEDAVNRALQALIRDYAFKSAPYPTSRDLITRLRAEAKPELQRSPSPICSRTSRCTISR